MRICPCFQLFLFSFRKTFWFLLQTVDWDKIAIACVAQCEISHYLTSWMAWSTMFSTLWTVTQKYCCFFLGIAQRRQLPKMHRSLFSIGIITLKLKKLQNLLKLRMSLMLNLYCHVWLVTCSSWVSCCILPFLPEALESRQRLLG